jgi:hypothetical protein
VHFQQKSHPSLTARKRWWLSVHSQKSISAFDVQNILNTADFVSAQQYLLPLRDKPTCDAAPYITVHTTRILCSSQPHGHTFETKSCQAESHSLLFITRTFFRNHVHVLSKLQMNLYECNTCHNEQEEAK